MAIWVPVVVGIEPAGRCFGGLEDWCVNLPRMRSSNGQVGSCRL